MNDLIILLSLSWVLYVFAYNLYLVTNESTIVFRVSVKKELSHKCGFAELTVAGRIIYSLINLPVLLIDFTIRLILLIIIGKFFTDNEYYYVHNKHREN